MNRLTHFDDPKMAAEIRAMRDPGPGAVRNEVLVVVLCFLLDFLG